MEYRFKADEWEKLSIAERAKRCRLMATEAQALAENAEPRIAETYLKIAADWLTLATEMERKSPGQPSPPL